MQTARNVLLAGIAACALAGSVGLALASPALHRMIVQLPDGGTAQIRYSGNVPPHISFGTNPFTAMDLISDEMNREMEAFMDAADFSPMPPMPLWAPEQPFPVGLRDVVPGATQYAAVSTELGNGVSCTHTMSVVRDGNGHSKVVSHSYGSCGALAAHATLGHEPHMWRGHPARGTIETKVQPNIRETPSSLVEAAYRPPN